MIREQAKVLEKIIKQKLLEKKDELFKREDEELARARKENKPKAEELFKRYMEIRKEEEELSERANKIGWDFCGERLDEYDGRYGGMKWGLKTKISQEYDKKRDELGKTELKLIAKVYGAGKEFDDVLKEIEKELNRF